jgi:hypothetical protein
MEVVIGVILLVGAFALGHHTADEETAQTRARLESDQAVMVDGDCLVPQRCRYRASGLVQRDLTVPYSQQRLASRTGSGSTKVALPND